MMLRRVAEALRRRDWFTIALEFVIVVFGILVGLRVNQWAEDRAERADEAEILDRLHDEVVAVIAAREPQERQARARAEDLYTIRKILFGFEDDRPLTAGECTSLSLSHNGPLPVDDVRVLEELVATGRMRVIGSEAVRGAVSALLLQRDRSRRSATSATDDSIDLTIEFPALIQVGLAPTDDPNDLDGFVPDADCDLAAMRASPRFLNALGANVGSYNGYVVEAFQRLSPVFAALHDTLDAELGLTHTGAGAGGP